MSPPVPRITPEEVKERLDQGEQILFIDTRNPTAWAKSDAIIPGANRMLASEVGNHIAELPKGRTIVAYCTWTEEASSARAALTLMEAGFSNVFALKGGFQRWKDVGNPMARKPAEPHQPAPPM